MKRFLFVCTGNTCRSPMAEGFFNHIAGQMGLHVLSESCGISAYAGSGASEYAVEVMAGYGVDLSRHVSKTVTAELVNSADRVYCMTKRHEAALKSSLPDCAGKITALSDSDIADPFMGSLENYQTAAEQIKKAVESLIKNLEG